MKKRNRKLELIDKITQPYNRACVNDLSYWKKWFTRCVHPHSWSQEYTLKSLHNQLCARRHGKWSIPKSNCRFLPDIVKARSKTSWDLRVSLGASSWELKGTACCAFFSAACTQDFDLQEMAPLRKFRALGSKVRAESGICLACLLNWWEAQRRTERGDYGGLGSRSTVTCMSTHQTRQHQLTNRNQTLPSTATTTEMRADTCENTGPVQN